MAAVRLNPAERPYGPLEAAVDVDGPLTKGAPFAKGPPRELWVGTPGTLNVITLAGTTLTDFPAMTGPLPIQVTGLLAGGTADDIWALY